jgi:F-type H+-transporting ATPase subunit epsilon
MADKTLHVDLVAQDRAVWSGQARMVIAKTVEGEIGLLPDHEPILAILGEGEVRITLADGEQLRASAEGGFLSMERNTVTVVARNAALI